MFKLRFGESKMSTAEVMIKDISDSKRINGNIYNEKLIHKNTTESSDLEIILNNDNVNILVFLFVFYISI